ncbi:unnamed protein product, partial [Discosporangium mesarthrocarpum]
ELNALNRLALEGVLAVIESIARRCQATVPQSGKGLSLAPTPLPNPADTGGGGAGRVAGMEEDPGKGAGAGTDMVETSTYNSPASESDSDLDSQSWGTGAGARVGAGGGGVAGLEEELGWLEQARARTAEVLQQRKKMKRRLSLAAERFNTGEKGWLEYAQELGLLKTPATPHCVAKFLKETVMLDRSMLGEYLSKGPQERYPFNAEVLKEYVKLFHMSDKSFVNALRAFLKEFRLPGEAQCIDRLMEAFAGELYSQGLAAAKAGAGAGAGERDREGSTGTSMSPEHQTMDPSSGARDSEPKATGTVSGAGNRGVVAPGHPFVNADAAFTMAFSAIMLNTDLHNPQIQDHRRMSLADFVRNNRQINGGKDLPYDFLEEVYNSIRENEIQVHRDHMSAAADGLEIDYQVHWDGILNRSNEVASASFTPSQAARKHTFPAGVHERDMFTSIAGPATAALCAVFDRTRDDLLVLRCLRGFRSCARASVYLGLAPPLLDGLLVYILGRGLVYMAAAAEGEIGPPFPEILQYPGLPDTSDITACAPRASGSAVHRDLLALKCGLELVRAYAKRVSAAAWEPLLECIFALADLQASRPWALLTDVDDFGDAQGNPLPPSVFARRCRDRARSSQNSLLSQAVRGRSVSGAAAPRGWGGNRGGLWGSLSGLLFSGAGEGGEGRGSTSAAACIAALAEVVVRIVHLQQLFPQTKDLPLDVVNQLLSVLLSSRDPSMPPRQGGGRGMGIGTPGDAAAASMEAHAVLALELSSRVVLANRHRVARLWPAVHTFLARVLGGDGRVTMMRMPFLVERSMVTVLRTCIHMLDREDMGPLLLESLSLLLNLPLDVVAPLSNRLASGLLIVVQANVTALTLASKGHWDVIALLMARSTVDLAGRGFTLEALGFITDRGLLVRYEQDNMYLVHGLLVRFVEGTFGNTSPDYTWTVQVKAPSFHPATLSLHLPYLSMHKGSSMAVTPSPSTTDESPVGQTAPQRHSNIVYPSLADSGRGGLGAAGELEPYGASTAAGREHTEMLHGSEIAAQERGSSSVQRGGVEELFLATLGVLRSMVDHPSARISKSMSETMQRIVANGVLKETWGRVFREELFKLPVNLQRHVPGVRGVPTDQESADNEEMHLRCCALLARSFLHKLPVLVSLPDFDRLWLEVVKLVGSNFSDKAPGSIAYDSCQQILTNMVMVMAHSGLLGPERGTGKVSP